MDSFDSENLQLLAKDLSDFFNKRVVILKPLPLPAEYYYDRLQMYFADSIIHYLHYRRPDSISAIVGLTHVPIFTLKKSASIDYYEEDMLGFGYQPGYASIISDHKLLNRDPKVLNPTMKKGIIHELGHNMGLSHCQDEKCVMHKPIEGNNYCESCKKKLFKYASR
jgi:archaemetzincin